MLTLHVPLDDNWWIAVNGIGRPGRRGPPHENPRSDCRLSIEFSARGGARYDCGMP